MPVENLLSPDLVRRLMWSPPEPRDADAVAAALRAGGAREWQIELTRDLLTDRGDHRLTPGPRRGAAGRAALDRSVTGG